MCDSMARAPMTMCTRSSQEEGGGGVGRGEG